MAPSYPVGPIQPPPIDVMPYLLFVKIAQDIGLRRLEWRYTPFRMMRAYPVGPVRTPPIEVMPYVLFVEIARKVDGAWAVLWKPATKSEAQRSELRRRPERRHACGLGLQLWLRRQQAED